MKRVNIHTAVVLLGIMLPSPAFVQTEVWSLHQCIDSTLVHNQNLKMKRNDMLISQEKKQEVKASLIPKIMLNADYKYFTNLPYQLLPLSVFNGPEGQFKEAQFGVPHNLNANLQLTMPLYNAQIFNAIKMSETAIELKSLQSQKTEEQIIFEVSNIYYNLYLIKQQLAFLDSNEINAKKLLKTTLLLKEQSMVKGTDVSKVKLQLAQLSNQKDILKSKREQLLGALKLTIGIDESYNLDIASTIDFEENKKYASHLSLDAQIAKFQNELTVTEMSSLKQSRLPSLALFGTFGYTGYGYDKKPNDFLNFYPLGFVGVQLQYPLFNGTITHRKISQKRIELTNRQLQTDWINRQTNVQIKNAQLQQTVARKSIENVRQQLNWAQSIYDQTILQNKNGVANITDVLLADNALREAQQNLLGAQIEYLKADLELKKSTNNLLIQAEN